MKKIKCPVCGNETFREWTEEVCCQSGVTIDADEHGELLGVNYDQADMVEVQGETLRLSGYECEECCTDFIVKDNKLVEEEDDECEAEG